MQANQVQPSETPPSVLDGYLSREELARELKITSRTLVRWKWERKGPPSVTIGGRIYYKRSDVKTWLDSLAGGDE